MKMEISQSLQSSKGLKHFPPTPFRIFRGVLCLVIYLSTAFMFFGLSSLMDDVLCYLSHPFFGNFLPVFAIITSFVLLIFTELVAGRFVMEKNRLKVVKSPESIKGNHDSAIGNFGIPQYGGSMAGTLVYLKDNKKGCKNFDDFGISLKAKPGAMPNFVLVDRGDCFFALKVWNSQNAGAGAAAVLVTYDMDEPLITMDSPEE